MQVGCTGARDSVRGAGEAVGFAVGGAEGALQDFAVIAGAGGVFVAEPLLQVCEGERLACVEQLGGDGGASAVAGERPAGVGFGNAGLAAERRDDPVVEVGLADELSAPGVDELSDDGVDRFGERAGGLVRRDS